MIRCFKRCFCIVCILLCLPFGAVSQKTIVLNDTIALEDIGKKTYFFEDTSLELSIDEIRKIDNEGRFLPYSQETINFSSSASAYWIKFEVLKTKADNFYLNVGSAYMDSISLYEFDRENKLISTRHTGDDLPFDTREIEVGDYLFALHFDTNASRTYYLRVKCDQPLFFPLRVGTLSNFVAHEHDLDFIQGIYFGFMLLIFLYNLFLYFSTRELIYLYYIAYVFSVTWFSASAFGYFFEYLWPNIPFLNRQAVVSTGLTMITATLFTQKFLNTKESDPRLHKGSMAFLVIGILVCALILFGFKIEGLKLAQIGLLIMAVYFLILGIRFKLNGYHPAIYYLSAWGALLIGISIATLESLNILTEMTHFINGIQIGSALEVVLLSFALGDRINRYKKQKEEAQLEALISAKENERLIQEQNIILEQKVKKRTEEVARQNKELLTLNEEKDTLVDMVAHDLRTPLHQMKGIIWLLDIPKMNITKDQESYLNQMDSSVDRLTQMVGRILNTHGLEANKVKLKNEIVNLVELVEYVVRYFYTISNEKHIALSIEAEEGNHSVELDKNYMIQVLENLLSNAIKFSKKGSKVILHVNSTNDKTNIVVEDQGPGISEEDQKKLFGRYQRLTAQPTAGEPSTGLGLSIVKKYVDAMNGDIRCESTLGMGTKFIISFDKS